VLDLLCVLKCDVLYTDASCFAYCDHAHGKCPLESVTHNNKHHHQLFNSYLNNNDHNLHMKLNPILIIFIVRRTSIQTTPNQQPVI
jgi:hypothetical protein